MSSFQQLCDICEVQPRDHVIFYHQLKERCKSWKAQSLWAKLDKRAAHREYKKGSNCANTRVSNFELGRHTYNMYSGSRCFAQHVLLCHLCTNIFKGLYEYVSANIINHNSYIFIRTRSTLNFHILFTLYASHHFILS